MKDTVKALVESAVTPDVDFITENTVALEMLDVVSEAAANSTTYFPQRVQVMKVPGEGYVVEYANNLERLMRDQNMGINEAMAVVAVVNEIEVEECTVLFDESCISKIDFKDLIKSDPKFNFARK